MGGGSIDTRPAMRKLVYWPRLIKTVLALVLTWTLLMMWGERKNDLLKGMPPGYYLEVSSSGYYRPCRNGRPLFTIRGESMSKLQSIRRAWEQYEFERSPRDTWSLVLE